MLPRDTSKATAQWARTVELKRSLMWEIMSGRKFYMWGRQIYSAL